MKSVVGMIDLAVEATRYHGRMFGRVVVLALVVVGLLTARVRAETLEMGAQVMRVDVKTRRATLRRGKTAGVAVGDTGELLPYVMMPDGHPYAVVDEQVRVALGKVIAVTDDEAILALDSIGGLIDFGSYYFAYSKSVSDARAASVLLRVASRITLYPRTTATPFVTFEALLGDPSDKRRDEVLDAMVADIQATHAYFETDTERIEGGRFHGKRFIEAVDAVDRALLLELLEWLDSVPKRYMGRSAVSLYDVFKDWVLSGTHSGEPTRLEHLAEPTIEAAYKAARAGKLDEARTQWQHVYAITIEDHAGAMAQLQRIDKVQLLQRAVAADPDNTAGRFELVAELFELEAYGLALTELAVLRKAKYEPFDVERKYGDILVRMKKFKEAEATYKVLVRDHPDDKELASVFEFVAATARAARSPGDPSALLAAADLAFVDELWTVALEQYRAVLDSARATPKQRETAFHGQERVSAQQWIDRFLEWAKDGIAEHDIAFARDQVTAIMTVANKVSDPARLAVVLEQIGVAAGLANEDDFAIEMLEKVVQLVPNDHEAPAGLASLYIRAERFDEAAAMANKALPLKGGEYAHQILALVARARGDVAEMTKQARIAADKYEDSAVPLLQLVRGEAIADHWSAAVEVAHHAVALQPGDPQARATYNAVTLGLQASESLQASPTSARERLRLVRALAELGLAKRANEEIAKLPADATWRADGFWAIVVSSDDRMLNSERLTAARNAKPKEPFRRVEVDVLEARAKLRASPQDPNARIALARAFLMTAHYDLALATLGALVTKPAAAEQLARDASEARAMHTQLVSAAAAAEHGDYAPAAKIAIPAQTLFDRLGILQGRVLARQLLSEALDDAGEFADAIAVAQDLRTVVAASGNAIDVSKVDWRIGRIKHNLGTDDELLKALNSNRTLCDDADDIQCLYYACVGLAPLSREAGRHADAIDFARKAWLLADRLGDVRAVRDARLEVIYANLAASRLGDVEQLALSLLTDSRKARDVINEQRSLLVLGEVAVQRGEGKAARVRFQEAYDLGTRTGDTGLRGWARELEATSWLVADRDAVKAAAAFEDAATLYRSLGEGSIQRSLPLVLRQLGDAYMQAGRLADARRVAKDDQVLAQRYARPPDLSWTSWLLASIALKEKKGAEALQAAKDALAFAQQTDDDGLLANAYHVLARAYAFDKKDQDAYQAYQKALEYLGRELVVVGADTDREGFMNSGTSREIFKDAVAHFLKLGKTARAMEVLEHARDAQLKRTFDAANAQTSDPAVRAKLDKYQQARARANGLENQLHDATSKPVAQRSAAQVKSLGQQIAKTRDELAGVALDLKVSRRNLYRALALDPETLMGRRKALPAGSVLVEYFVADDALYAFIISADLTQPAVVRVPVASTDLVNTVIEFRAAVVQEGSKLKARDKVEALGRKLGDWLLRPVRSHLDGATTVIVVPFGALYYVPFDALVVSDEGKPVRYAIEDFRFSIQTGDTVESVLGTPRARGTGTMLAVANPDGSLPGAQREVALIKKGIPGARVLGRKDGTIKMFRNLAGGVRYIHLATHGILDVNPTRSYLKMSDGNLTVKEISTLQGLDTTNEMVVLSACKSAIEEGAEAGNDVISLASGFALAGAPSLVASLWEVDDDATAELMAAFYRALAAAGGDRLEALRSAKLDVLRTKQGKATPYAAPWYWSGFQLYGDFRAP